MEYLLPTAGFSKTAPAEGHNPFPCYWTIVGYPWIFPNQDYSAKTAKRRIQCPNR
jgi:hypothetical protein